MIAYVLFIRSKVDSVTWLVPDPFYKYHLMWELWDQISTLGKYRATSIVRDKIWKRYIYIWYSQLDQLLPTVLSSSPRERNIFSDRGNLQVFRVRCVLQISHPAVYSKSLHKGAMRQLKTNQTKIQWWTGCIFFLLETQDFCHRGSNQKKADSKASKKVQKLESMESKVLDARISIVPEQRIP